MFLNTMSRIHCKLQGFWCGGGDPEVSPRSPPPGSAAGAARHYNLRLPTEGLRQGHGLAVVAGARIIKGYRPCRRPRNSDRRWPKRDERQIFRPHEFVGGHLYHCVSSWFCSGSPICISVFTTVRRSWLNMTAGRCLVHTTYALIVENETLAVSRCRLNERR